VDSKILVADSIRSKHVVVTLEVACGAIPVTYLLIGVCPNYLSFAHVRRCLACHADFELATQ